MPDRTAGAAGPVIVVGFLTAASGLGVSARLCHDALRLAGRPVLGIDLSARFRQDAARVGFDFVDGRHHLGPATVILHVNSPFVPLALWSLGRRLIRQKHIVGYWAWELPNAPDEWRTGARFVHRVLVPSRFTADALRGVAGGRPIDVLHHPVAMPDAVAVDAIDAADPAHGPSGLSVLVVFNMASGFERKNPLAAIAAFREAFAEDRSARLVVKVLNGDTDALAMQRLRLATTAVANASLDERNLSPGEMQALFASADVVISLHRSEGFGLVVAEAMLAGRPVVATDWSGSTDFLTAANGMPVSCRLQPAIDPTGEYHQPTSHWAEASVSEAAARLRELAADPELRRHLGMAARADALRMFAPDRYVERLEALLGIS